MAIPKVYNGSSWVTSLMKCWNGSGWEYNSKFHDGTDWVSLGLRVSASDVHGQDSGFTPSGTVIASGANPVVTGGSGNYTYSWVQTGPAADGGPFSINSASLESPTWSDNRSSTHSDNNEDWTLTVTDTANGATASVTISVTLTWVNLN